MADNTADELLPYAAYLGADGSILDTMFDAFAFVPCHGDYPSGGRLVKTNGKPGAVMSDWLLYLENTFAEGINLDALDKTVAHVNEQLGRDTPCKVFLTMPYPLTQDKPFGDIDGDGREEYTRTNDERLAVLAWYESECARRFDEAGYENLTLVGFYWYREEVNSADSADEDGFTRQATALLHEKGHKLLFDPFFTSAGFERWSELGFDGAVMQPNLVFNDYFETEMLEEFTEIIRKYGLGVEIETGRAGSFRSAATRTGARCFTSNTCITAGNTAIWTRCTPSIRARVRAACTISAIPTTRICVRSMTKPIASSRAPTRCPRRHSR